MYILTDLGNDQWKLTTKSFEVKAVSRLAMVALLVSKFGFTYKDIEDGMNLLFDPHAIGHDTIHFGIWKSPIFTENSKQKAS